MTKTNKYYKKKKNTIKKRGGSGLLKAFSGMKQMKMDGIIPNVVKGTGSSGSDLLGKAKGLISSSSSLMSSKINNSQKLLQEKGGLLQKTIKNKIDNKLLNPLQTYSKEGLSYLNPYSQPLQNAEKKLENNENPEDKENPILNITPENLFQFNGYASTFTIMAKYIYGQTVKSRQNFTLIKRLFQCPKLIKNKYTLIINELNNEQRENFNNALKLIYKFFNKKIGYNYSYLTNKSFKNLKETCVYLYYIKIQSKMNTSITYKKFTHFNEIFITNDYKFTALYNSNFMNTDITLMREKIQECFKIKHNKKDLDYSYIILYLLFDLYNNDDPIYKNITLIPNIKYSLPNNEIINCTTQDKLITQINLIKAGL